jgi:hypothetical protein
MWEFIKRRKNTLFWVAAGTAGAYCVGQYARWKMEEMAEQAERDRLAREKHIFSTYTRLIRAVCVDGSNGISRIVP